METADPGQDMCQTIKSQHLPEKGNHRFCQSEILLSVLLVHYSRKSDKDRGRAIVIAIAGTYSYYSCLVQLKNTTKVKKIGEQKIFLGQDTWKNILFCKSELFRLDTIHKLGKIL